MVTHAQNTKLIALGSNQKSYEFGLLSRYEFVHRKHKLTPELIEEPDGFVILSCKGLRYPVEIVSQKQNNYEILINGVTYNFSVETPFSLKRNEILARQQSQSPTLTIKAPMPGKILNIPVVEGQEVNQGEALLILEAMKMQNTITAQSKGKVEKIAVKSGENVGKDDVLVVMKRH